MLRKLKKYIPFILFMIAISSCAPTKEAAYLRKDNEISNIDVPDKIYEVDHEYNIFIEVGDELYITVTSGNEEPSPFDLATGPAINDLELLSYKVNEDGNIKLPFIEDVKVTGMTLSTASDSLETVLKDYIYLPTVTIRFVNCRISVLGEVGAPGLYVFNRKKINIYEVLAEAGDIGIYGNRKNVMIVRDEGNQIIKKHIDVTNSQIINSDWYYLQPNDIVYVEPLGRRRWGIETFPYDLLFSVFSTSMLIFTFMISLYN